MALPALTKTWQFQVNNQVAAQGSSLATSRLLLRSIKNALLGTGAWTNSSNGAVAQTNPMTVKGSCNGAGGAGSFGNNDNVDRWTSDATLVWNTAGSNHSWIVLQFGGSGAQICLDLNSATDTVLTMVLSTSGGFFAANGGTDGTATARPTAADENVVGSAVSYGAPGNTTTRWHVLKSSDGLVYRVLINVSGQTRGFWQMERVNNRIGASWPEPTIATLDGSNASVVATTGDLMNTASSVLPRSRDDTANIQLIWTCEGKDNQALNIFETTPIDKTGENPMFPSGLYSITAGHIGPIGSLIDAWWGLSNFADGTTYPALGTLDQFVQFSDVIMPWNQSVPQLA